MMKLTILLLLVLVACSPMIEEVDKIDEIIETKNRPTQVTQLECASFCDPLPYLWADGHVRKANVCVCKPPVCPDIETESTDSSLEDW